MAVARVDDLILVAFERIKNDLAKIIKEEFGVDNVIIQGTMASQILASMYLNKKEIDMKIKKVNRSKTILVIN